MFTEIDEGFRVSPQQKRIWLLQQDSLQPYCSQGTIVIEGELSASILIEAVRQVVRRHEILRTSFQCLPGMDIPVQVINENSEPLSDELDLSDVNPEAQEARIDELCLEQRNTRFDFGQGSLMRCTLLSLSAEKHALLISLPALCADARTFTNLTLEISRCYEACANQLELTDEPAQYADLSEWQNELLESESTAAGRAYWCEKDFSALLTFKLPFDTRQNATQSFAPQSLSAPVAPHVAAKIESLAAAHQLSSEAILLACWQTLLWRLTSQPDIITGVAYDNRKYDELKEAFGPLAKYLPLHFHAEEHYRFREVARQVQERLHELSKWGEYFSWEQVAAMNENLDERSFFPVCFEMLEQPVTHRAADLSFSLDGRYSCLDRFKVKLSCVLKNESLITEWHFDSSLLRIEDIQRLSAQYHRLLESVADDSESLVSELEILGDAEKHQLLVGFNQTKADYQTDTCLHELFERQAARTPDGLAVIFEDERVSYRELNARANQLANYLRQRGVGAGSLVCVYMERSVEMVLALLGVIKAGAAYVPLDAMLPQARLAYMIEDAQAKVLLTQHKLSDGLPEHKAHVISLDTDWDKIASESRDNPETGVTADDLAYIIYTSGSTGWPKGVMISHQAICNRILWGQTVYPMNETDRVMQNASPGFDFSVWEIFAPLLTGACLVLPRPGGHQDTAYLAKLVAEQQVTTIHFVPTLLQLFLEEQGIAACGCLKRVFCGGEALPVALQERFFARLDADLYNQYGPTEATVDATFYLCERGSERQSVPIGRPIANTQTYILDRRAQLLPIGVPGELHIAGLGLARGYLNRPALTAEKFIPNPFSDEPGARLYRSGDLARYLPDGNIEFLGRTDHQVKLRGTRIELGEIEALLSQHQSVREAVALVREDSPNDKRLVAYVVARAEQAPVFSELHGFLREKLPEYMVPSAFVMLSALPLTVSGKIDRLALPAPEQARAELEAAYVAPASPIEKTLAEAWCQVLGRERIGVNDNFFELGGHSLTAMQLISRLREAFRLELPLRSLFEAPMIGKLAEVIEEMLVEKIEELSEEEAQRLLAFN